MRESYHEVWRVCDLFIFFFKQKTAYEMRISDWSSDVCSSDLRYSRAFPFPGASVARNAAEPAGSGLREDPTPSGPRRPARRQTAEIGRASCRERVCQYV